MTPAVPRDPDVGVHLQMIVDVVARMASNSFSLKTLAVAFVAGFLAYLGARPHPPAAVFYGVAMSVAVFWLLDAQYLRLERIFRSLYDKVRTQTSTDYSMDVTEAGQKVASLSRIAFSWSVVWLYAALIAGVIVLAINQ
ncbi:MAG: hypothetical protein WB609_01535 [Candidatus Cybelea sp.]